MNYLEPCHHFAIVLRIRKLSLKSFHVIEERVKQFIELK